MMYCRSVGLDCITCVSNKLATQQVIKLIVAISYAQQSYVKMHCIMERNSLSLENSGLCLIFKIAQYYGD